MSNKEPKPKTLQPWDRRPWPLKGDPDMDVLYASVGRTLSQWERYEGVLSLLFSAFVSGSESQAAKRAYVSVRTSEGRAEMLRAASEAYFSDHPDSGQLDPFKSVLRHITCFSQRRNDIAHGVLEYYLRQGPEGGAIIPDERSYAIYPSYASFRERNLSNFPTYCMTSVELNYFHGHFSVIADEAAGVAGHILRAQRQSSPQRHSWPARS
jgi:hypothetical protein